MKRRTLLFVPALLLALAAAGSLRSADPRKPPEPQPLKMADILAWKQLRTAALSPDGQWFAYRLMPAEGNGELVLRKAQNGEEKRFATGEAKGAGDVVFSDDSKWLAFTVNPPKQKKPAPEGKKAQAKLVVLELATGAKQEFEKVRRFVFAPKGGGWLAMHKGAGEPPAPATVFGLGPVPGSEKTTSSDLILRELGAGTDLNIGNVSEFAFDKNGQWLALVIDASNQGGNGVQLRNLAAATQITLDSGKASYKGLSWTEKGDALAVLKGVEDKKYEDKLYSVVGFTDLGAKSPRKVVYDPQSDKAFPAGMSVSPNRNAAWTDDLAGLTFGIHKLRKKEKADDKDKKPAKEDVAEKKTGEGDKTGSDEELSFQPPRKPPAPGQGAKPGPDAKDRPDVVIWHWKDPTLQSEQQVKSGFNKNHSYLCIYRVHDKQFYRLADETMKTVSVSPRSRWAIGQDSRAYDLSGSLDGRRYSDYYVIDLQTGERKPAVKKHRWGFVASPDGTHALYYDDGNYHTYEFATGKTFNLTAGAPTSFINTEDDHNVVKPPTPVVGWVKGGTSVLLSDNWDVWQFPVHGGKAINLTAHGKRDGVRYQRRIVLDPEEKGIDLEKTVYFAVLGERTKKGGIAAVEKGEPGARKLLWEDAAFNTLIKAKKADVFAYTRETFTEAPEYFVAGPTLVDGRKMTDSAAQQRKLLWSKGSMLVNYTSAKGKKLQGALYLPANYESGKSYPTIVYIYEKLSQGLNRFAPPTASGFNPAVYTSNGYAVFTPDIVYQINDPGRSAVWCVLPALEAAIATGVVDRDCVGLHGHSWGGYQTSFLITQTDVFKAAVAGAPLTNLISMYSSIYWNTGFANQPIFESSQGRFTHPYWDDIEAYTRNSPVYFAKNVKTPLLLLHNDRDGAVDWNQGIEYFNTLRRLGKPVVMLQYRGENHGLAKAPNQRDYSVRMREFFDHHLRGQPAPAWLREGVSHLDHDEHIKERAKMLK
jgi:dipeptidyl aminopeptidase/acylaminoacyl peptidase